MALSLPAVFILNQKREVTFPINRTSEVQKMQIILLAVAVNQRSKIRDSHQTSKMRVQIHPLMPKLMKKNDRC